MPILSQNPSLIFNRAARRYAEKGWPVFPLRPRGKKPLTDHGFKDATTSPDLISNWWRRWPDANVGIATGKVSGLVVVDVDPRNGGDDTLWAMEEQHGPLEAKLEALTGGGGRHLYFQYSNAPDRWPKVLGAGLDIKADGGYIVAPPSLHPSGANYMWEVEHHPEDNEPGPLPRPWLELLGERSGCQTPGRTDAEWRDLVRHGAPVGERNNSLARLAGKLLAQRWLSPMDAREFLHWWNPNRCPEPLPEAEVETVVRSIAERQLRKECSRG